MPRAPYFLSLVVLGSLGAACVTGTVGGDPVGEGKSPLCTKLSPGPSPMRRMTRFEYNNTIRALLNDQSDLANGFVVEEESLGFNNQAAALGITQLPAEQYMEAAEKLAATAVKDLGKLLPCDPQKAGEDACAEQFITQFGKRATRRPLGSDLHDRLVNLYKTSRAAYDFPTAIQLVVEALLQTPEFLYRVEFGMPDPIEADVVALDSYELASRLSYLLWGGMPDEELFAAADKNELSTAAQIEKQARRMLDDDRARGAVTNFHEQWLRLDHLDNINKDATYYPAFTPALPALWKQETEAFLGHVIFDEHGSVADMLTAPYSMMNADLAAFYGVQGPSSSTFEKVMLDPARRGGLLTQASILALYAKPNQSSPVHRGKFVRERLLCQGLPPPPPNIKIVAPEVKPGSTTRERFAQHDKDPYCYSCHHLMDPIGFGFEHFDGIGLWRDTDQGLPVDATGEVTDTEDADGKFDGVVELAQHLSQSEQVRECIATNWFRYGYGRGEQDEDACNLDQIRINFEKGGFNVKELLVALTQTDAFRYRHKVVAGGGP